MAVEVSWTIRNIVLAAWTIALVLGGVTAAAGQDGGQRRAERGPGLPTSMFGTYVERGELLVYPFFEYYQDDNFEYKPEDLGYPGDTDYRGRFRANEGILFFAYGLSENVAVEFEVATIQATLQKSADDLSAVPATVTESGLGDVEGQIRWRWRKETDHRPELFSYTELVVPHHRDAALIGTPGWELKFGTGVIRGFSWGTVTARAAIEYTTASGSHFDVGEYAVEYLKSLSPAWRVYVGIEGTQDEVSLITEAQWRVHPRVSIKVNSGVGLTSKATDWAPEVGVLFRFSTPRARPRSMP